MYSQERIYVTVCEWKLSLLLQAFFLLLPCLQQIAGDLLHSLSHGHNDTWHSLCWTSQQSWLEQVGDTQIASEFLILWKIFHAFWHSEPFFILGVWMVILHRKCLCLGLPLAFSFKVSVKIIIYLCVKVVGTNLAACQWILLTLRLKSHMKVTFIIKFDLSSNFSNTSIPHYFDRRKFT